MTMTAVVAGVMMTGTIMIRFCVVKSISKHVFLLS